MQRRWLALSFVAWTGVAAASGPGLLAEPLPRIPTPEEGARLDALAFAETFVNQVVRDQGYPAEALALGLEGTVRVTVVIGPDGRVKAASVAASSGHPLLDGLKRGEHAYFVHSYALVGHDADDVIATTDYGGPVVAMVARGNIAGTQFHVEKSQHVGLTILANFLGWEP